MENTFTATASLRNFRGSARKARLILDMVRGKKVTEAKNILRFSTKKMSKDILTLLNSAVANAHNIHGRVEAGKGRADCLIKPIDKSAAAVVVEFKHLKSETQSLKEESLKGVEQIEDKAYAHNLRAEGYMRIYKYGIAFHKKTCEVAIDASS